jgi:hypothetical protein
MGAIPIVSAVSSALPAIKAEGERVYSSLEAGQNGAFAIPLNHHIYGVYGFCFVSAQIVVYALHSVEGYSSCWRRWTAVTSRGEDEMAKLMMVSKKELKNKAMIEVLLAAGYTLTLKVKK